MSFRLHIAGNTYTKEAFLEQTQTAEWLLPFKQFLLDWDSGNDFVFYTSGSTGTPKPLGFSKQQLIHSARLTQEFFGAEQGNEHILMCLNLHFVAGAMMLARALVWDSEISVFPPTGNILQTIQADAGYTFASFVPYQLKDIAGYELQIKSIRTILIGGTALPLVLEGWLKENHTGAWHTYGMTETLTHVALRKIGQDWYTPLGDYEINLDSDSRIIIRGGILKEAVLTNDLGICGEGKAFKVLGRADFMINSGGIKVFPEQLENLIGSNLQITEGFEFYIGRKKHETLGQAVVMVSTQAVKFKEQEQIREMLTMAGLKYHVPKIYLQLKQIPRLDNGKTDRKKLNEWIENQNI